MRHGSIGAFDGVREDWTSYSERLEMTSWPQTGGEPSTSRIQRRLLLEPFLTCKKALELAQAFKSNVQDSQTMGEIPVHLIRNKPELRSWGTERNSDAHYHC